MIGQPGTFEEAMAAIEELRLRLEEAEETILAIQSGQVDAVVVSGPEGEQIYTLTGAERTYRILVEAMNEGALVLSPEGVIIYCNGTFASMLGVPVYEALGHTVYEFVAESDAEPLKHMLEQAPQRKGKMEAKLKHGEAPHLPVFISTGSLETDEGPSVSAVVTDLTEHKRTEAELEKYREHLEELVTERTRELAESEQRVVSILESISDGFLAFDGEWRPVYMNSEGERQMHMLTGRTKEDLLGKSIWEEFPEAVGTRIYNTLHKAVEDQLPSTLEARHSQSGRWFEIRLFPSPDGLSVYSTDITDRKQAEEALQESEERFRALFEYSPDAVFLTVPEGIIRAANPAASEMFGMTEEEICRAGRAGLIDPDDPRQASLAEERRRAGQVVGVEAGYIRKNGEKFTAETSSVILPGDPPRAFVILRDITERKQIEQRRQEVYEREHHISDMLQQALIPSEIPCELKGFSIAVKYQSALEEALVGGDFYDIFELDSNLIGVLIGDVAGKGLQAAVRVAAARYAFRSYAYLDPSPSRVMTLANDALCREGTEVENALTAFFAVVDTADNTMTYATGGHEPPVVCNAQEGVEELSVTGAMLGVMPGISYTEETRSLQEGENVVMFTDGITEARRNGTVLFEKTGVIEHLKRACDAQPDEIAEALLNAATLHAEGHLQDDVAIVVLGLERGE